MSQIQETFTPQSMANGNALKHISMRMDTGELL